MPLCLQVHRAAGFRGFGQIADSEMTRTLPREICSHTYLAFRAGFVVVLDCLLSESLDTNHGRSPRKGLFDCFPMLVGTAPQIQLELLLKTWSRRTSGLADSTDLISEFVSYAALDCLARVADQESPASLQMALKSPVSLPVKADLWLSRRVRCLQIAGADPHSTEFCRELTGRHAQSPSTGSGFQSLRQSNDELLDILGRWAACPKVILTSEMLLTDDEQHLLKSFFEEHPGLLRS
jgi:hypothetical protein